jgi:hypothetical protein
VNIEQAFEGGGTMPQCEDDSSMRLWFHEDAEPGFDGDEPAPATQR